MIQLPPPPVSRLIGFTMKSIEPGHAIFDMEADELHRNPMSTLHGGIYCDRPMQRWASPTPLPWRKGWIEGTGTHGSIGSANCASNPPSSAKASDGDGSGS